MNEYSQLEKANQVAEQMQFAVFDAHGRAAQIGLYVLTIAMVVLAIIAMFAESDICAEATGKLEPLFKVHLIQPTTDGTIAEYKVRDGQMVKAGDTLVVLNTVRAEAEWKKKEQELSILERELKDHINAKNTLAQIITKPEIPSKERLAIPDAERVAGQLYASRQALDAATYDISGKGGDKRTSPEMSVLQAHKQALQAVREARTKSLTGKAAEREAESKKNQARVSLLESSLEKARKQLSQSEAALSDARKEMAIYERGRQLGVASEVKFLDVQNYMHQREYGVAQQKLQIADLEQALKSARVDLKSRALAYNADRLEMGAAIKSEDARISGVPLLMNETMRQLQHKQAAFDVASYHARGRYSTELTEIASLERKIRECQAAIVVLKALLNEREMKAPIDGTISKLVNILPGQIVLRGQTLMTLVPEKDALVLRAEVSNRDVGFVEVGQDARLRIDAFPCEEFGIIHGKVIRVGNYPEQKVVNQKKSSVYRVDILPAQPYLQADRTRYELKPGLLVHADIVLRKRSWLALLFEPLLKLSNN